ncbi:hypothetical protein ACFQ3Z_03250 [Streptomyces nogalater]
MSLYAGWLTVDDVRDRSASERAIAAACDRLVSGAAVMDLDGGTVRAETSDYDRIDARGPRGSCTVYRASGSGRTTGLFSLAVRSGGEAEPLNWIGDRTEPFALPHPAERTPKTDLTAVADRRPEPRPLGDGTLGWYGNWYTTVRAECGPGSSAAAPAAAHHGQCRLRRRGLRGGPGASGPHRPLGRRDPHPADRLPHPAARPARRAAGARADRPASRAVGRRFLRVVRRVSPALGARSAARPGPFGTGAGHASAGGLPAGGQSRPGPPHRRRSARGQARLRRQRGHPLALVAAHRHLHRRRGPRGGVRNHRGRGRRHQAGDGRARERRLVGLVRLRGKPAVHTLTTSYAYDNVLGSRTVSALLRAYVDDMAERRGCTRVTYPDAADSGDR